MTPERWKRIQEVFATALEREPTARAAFLKEACRSDADLMKEVESLLVSHDATSSRLLDSPAIDAVSPTPPSGKQPSLTQGRRLGPYEILGALGAGGMGEVYRARDSKLRREVAIKVLPQSLAADPEALARFEREAFAVAALSHPNILAIHDFGNDGGTTYAVMELLEGQTLRDKLDLGPIPQKQAVDYALQIARGLSAAHEKGVVHRDLKPENLFVTKDGHLKILDFGLAKRVESVAPGKETSAPTASGETQPGVVMGTLGYMSPEQVRGLPVDHRSDIFSFGTILYELLSGKRAFKRETAADTMAAIMREEPPELSASGRDISPALDHIVKHCLEKDRDNRFQTAKDVAFNLSETSSAPGTSESRETATAASKQKRLLRAASAVGVALLALLLWRGNSALRPASQAASRKPVRIVVLLFENLGAPQDAYFAAGITEEISSRLGNLQGLAVISRATAVAYDRKGKSIKQIGSDLGVDFVLEGTVQWDRGAGGAGHVRITPELIKVSDDVRLWAGHYDRVVADILAIQSEVAENVVKAMGVKLASREESALKAASTSDMEAYDLYLRGLEMVTRDQTKQNFEGAIRMFEAAVDRDPRFPQALAQLARTHLYIYILHLDRSAEHVESAKVAVDRLSKLGPDLAETHFARAYYLYSGLGDYPGAIAEFKAALALQPSNSDSLSGMGFVLRRQGRWKEALEPLGRWLELDPRNPIALFQYGFTCEYLGRYADADRVFALATSFNPLWGTTWGWKARLQILWRGDVEKTMSILADANRVAGLQDDLGFVALASFQAALCKGDFSAALRQLNQETRKELSNQYSFLPIDLLRAEVLTLSGQTEVAKGSFQTARHTLEELIEKKPDDSRYYSALGIAFAGLGLREEALRAASKAVELMPGSKDALLAPWRMVDLALVRAMVGQSNEAIDLLESVLSNPSDFSAQVVRVDPRWDSLRSNPRLQALLAKYGGGLSAIK